MSARNRSEHPRPDRMELRKRSHGERHRVHSELDQIAGEINAGTEPDDVVEPGTAYKPETVHDHSLVKSGRAHWLKHWKTKDWKRRKVNRARRNRAARGED